MVTIAQIATAVPPYRMTCAEVKQVVRQVFPIAPHRLEAVMQLFDHAQVAQRYSALPLDQLIRPRSLTERSRDYQEHAIALGRQVAANCLAQAHMRPDEIDMLITVSCTGYMIPSLDAYLASELGFRADVRRLPITELGCIGGAMALSHAYEFVRAYPERNALVVAVELSSLTFQPNDRSPDNLIASALFILIVELLNSAIEAIVDRISRDRHPLSKNAKDFGSAAVTLALAMAVLIWGVILYPIVCAMLR